MGKEVCQENNLIAISKAGVSILNTILSYLLIQIIWVQGKPEIFNYYC